MKKYLLITALILATASQPAISQEMFENPEDLENMQEKFYEAPAVPIPTVEVKDGSTIGQMRAMPLFKKTRIKMTNYFRERDYNKAQKLLKKEQTKDDEVKVNFVDPVKNNTETFELSGEVKEQVAPNDVMLDADNIDYDEKTFDITATGNPILRFPPQETTIKAEKMIYNQASNILKAYGPVEVIRNGTSVFGDFMQINLNEENVFIDNVKTKHSFLTVTARNSEIEGDKIILNNGRLESKGSYRLDLETRMIGGNRFAGMMIDDDERSSITDEIGDTIINVKAKEVIVDAKKNHDTLTLKKAKIHYGDTSLFTIPSLTIHTNKNHNYFEGNYPELGSRSRMGMFLGPGFAFDTPLQNGSTVKLIPMINNKKGIGIGGFLKYRSATNYTDFGYGSAADIFILKGRQMFDDKFYMQYGANSYLDEWFLGGRMAKYGIEMIYKDQGIIHDSIGKDLDLTFKHRAGFGFMRNNDYNSFGEHFPKNDMSTTRTRYMAEASQTLFSRRNKKELKSFSLSLVMQGSAALYGTGDTQFVGRIGPRIHTQYKHWMQDIGYFISAFEDNTPMPAYDMYRYGRSSFYVREAIRLNKYISLAWSGSVTPSDDTPNGRLFQENAFIIALGPDDFKFNLGYDCVRQHTYFSFVIAMDTKGSSLDFERMEIKNPDRLAKSDEEQVKLKVFDADVKEVTPKKMMYAEVIDIEDPNKEDI